LARFAIEKNSAPVVQRCTVLKTHMSTGIRAEATKATPMFIAEGMRGGEGVDTGTASS